MQSASYSDNNQWGKAHAGEKEKAVCAFEK